MNNRKESLLNAMVDSVMDEKKEAEIRNQVILEFILVTIIDKFGLDEKTVSEKINQLVAEADAKLRLAYKEQFEKGLTEYL